MKKALISPLENNRVAQIENIIFEVAEPFFWVDCPDDIATEWTYVNGEFIEPVIPEQPEIVVEPQPTKEELLAKLQEIQNQILALG